MVNELLQHPLSAAFPAMSETDLDALTEDIKKNGQREHGMLYEGMVLDGWHRYLACKKAGKPFLSFGFSEEQGDPVSYVLSRNLHRRHLSAAQRAAAVVATTNWRSAGRINGKHAPGARLTTNAEMAKTAEVAPRTIQQAKVAHQAGLGEAVRDGMLSLKEAAQVASGSGKPPKKEKKPAAADPRDAEIKRLREQAEEANEKREAAVDTARDLEDKLTAYEKTEPDEQQKEIMRLQKRVVKLEGEVERLTRARNDCQAKCNELIREVKKLRKRG